MMMSSIRMGVVLLLTGLLLGGAASTASAEDELNCVLCHKYRGLSRVTEKGDLRLFYINEAMFEKSPHAKLTCVNCHQDINEIPHKPAKKVDCTTECHLNEPSSGNKFSHKRVAETLSKSVHSKVDANGNPKEFQEDYPGCKDCHEEPLYRPLSFFKGKDYGVSERGLSRCQTCHQTGDFAKRFYNHVTTRLQKTRKPSEIVAVCARCHGDPDFQERHKLDDVVNSYKGTFHYKALRFGSEQTPDCTDCHVVSGENVHLVEGKTSPTSANNERNVLRTCRSSGCHEKAGEKLSGFRVHVTYEKDKYPMQHYMLKFFTALMAVVLYFFLALIFLELLRKLFPHFSFRKSPDDVIGRSSH